MRWPPTGCSRRWKMSPGRQRKQHSRDRLWLAAEKTEKQQVINTTIQTNFRRTQKGCRLVKGSTTQGNWESHQPFFSSARHSFCVLPSQVSGLSSCHRFGTPIKGVYGENSKLRLQQQGEEILHKKIQLAHFAGSTGSTSSTNKDRADGGKYKNMLAQHLF